MAGSAHEPALPAPCVPVLCVQTGSGIIDGSGRIQGPGVQLDQIGPGWRCTR